MARAFGCVVATVKWGLGALAAALFAEFLFAHVPLLRNFLDWLKGLDVGSLGAVLAWTDKPSTMVWAFIALFLFVAFAGSSSPSNAPSDLVWIVPIAAGAIGAAAWRWFGPPSAEPYRMVGDPAFWFAGGGFVLAVLPWLVVPPVMRIRDRMGDNDYYWARWKSLGDVRRSRSRYICDCYKTDDPDHIAPAPFVHQAMINRAKKRPLFPRIFGHDLPKDPTVYRPRSAEEDAEFRHFDPSTKAV